MKPEFSRLVAVDRVPPQGLIEHISADEDERRGLAKRFGLLALSELSATLKLEPWRRGGIHVSGALDATVDQTCVVSLDSFTSRMAIDLSRYFSGAPQPGPAAAVHSVESLEDDEPDVISGGSIDLGEIVAEELGLALDPYPRKPGIEFSPPPAGPEDEPNQGPFGDLTSLRAIDERKRRQ
jgi:hypothetical protein